MFPLGKSRNITPEHQKIIDCRSKMMLITLTEVYSLFTISSLQDLKPSNLAVNEDCELKVSELLLSFKTPCPQM